MKKKVMLALAAIALVFSCADRDRRFARVFAVNAYPRAVSLMIGDEPGPEFYVAELGTGGVTATARVRAGGPFPVYYRPAGFKEWQRLPEELAEAGGVFRPGTVTALIVDARGFIRLATLADDARSGARLSFINATPGTVSSLDIYAPRAEAAPVWRARDVRPGAATRFRSIAPGDYLVRARFGLRPPGAGARALEPAGFESAFRCPEPAHWLLFCFLRDGAPVFELRPLDLGTGDPVFP